MGFSSRRLAAAAAARVPGHPFFFAVGECSVCVLSLGAVARWAWPACWPVHPPPSTRKPHGPTAPCAGSCPSRRAAPRTWWPAWSPSAWPPTWASRWWWTTSPARAAPSARPRRPRPRPPPTHCPPPPPIPPPLSPRLAYDPRKDFPPVAHVADAPSVLLVTNSLPVKTVGELVAYGKAHPGKPNYATSGNGTIVHLNTAAFSAQAGLEMTHIPYKGTALAIPDLIAGQTHVLFDSLPTGMPHAKAGRLRALAVTSEKRSTLAPELPTLAESGLPGYSSVTWFGVYLPAGAPPA